MCEKCILLKHVSTLFECSEYFSRNSIFEMDIYDIFLVYRQIYFFFFGEDISNIYISYTSSIKKYVAISYNVLIYFFTSIFMYKDLMKKLIFLFKHVFKILCTSLVSVAKNNHYLYLTNFSHHLAIATINYFDNTVES